MKIIIILGVIFTLWEGFITHLFPSHDREHYEKAAEKWSMSLPLALIGLMDMVSILGLIIVCISSFFLMAVGKAILFCALIGLILLFNPSGMKASSNMRRALQEAEKASKK